MLPNLKEQAGQALAVVGLQYGSEGKGAITEYLAPLVSAGVRVGSANAGHTVYYQNRRFVLRQLPTAWVNPQAELVIGISAIIHLPVLLEEIARCESLVPIKNRLYIDGRAHVITAAQMERERSSALAETIASTSARSGLGIGAAMADKVLRTQDCVQAKDVPALAPYLADTVSLLNEILERDEIVLFEGTQGYGLSLEHGAFPYVTSRDTTAQALFAGAGINPYGFDVRVIGVARTYPIRVAGHSGPFDADSIELDWSAVAARSGTTRNLTEQTSVTGLTRRVATFSWQGFDTACQVNRPTEIALTFADYLDASLYGEARLSAQVEAFIAELEAVSLVPVGMVKTGPQAIIDFDQYRRSLLRRL